MLKIDCDPFAGLLKVGHFVTNGKGFKKNPKNKKCSQMYEVFHLNEAYVDVV
jgi:hypothetical protein